MNFGLSLDELKHRGKPIVGLAPTGRDLSPCNRHHIELAHLVCGPHRDRYEMAYWTGRRIVEMINEDLRPSTVMTRKAFENAIVASSGACLDFSIKYQRISTTRGLLCDNH